jgi:putative membrane protein
MIGGLSLSVALAQTTGTSGTGTASGQSGSQNRDNTTGTTGTSAGQSESQNRNQTTGAAGGQQQSSSQGHVAGAGGSEDQSMVGPNDRKFMMKAAHGGMMEVQLAQLAQQKSASEEVKQYAKRLEQDHSKANEQLKKIAGDRQVDLPTDLGPHQQQMARFENLSGAEFDRAYIKMQVKHHKKDISEFRKQADRGMDTDLKEFASAQLPTLEQHLQQAQQLQSSTGTRSRQADSPSSGSNSQGASSGETGSRPQSGHEEHDSKKSK